MQIKIQRFPWARPCRHHRCVSGGKSTWRLFKSLPRQELFLFWLSLTSFPPLVSRFPLLFYVSRFLLCVFRLASRKISKPLPQLPITELHPLLGREGKPKQHLAPTAAACKLREYSGHGLSSVKYPVDIITGNFGINFKLMGIIMSL